MRTKQKIKDEIKELTIIHDKLAFSIPGLNTELGITSKAETKALLDQNQARLKEVKLQLSKLENELESAAD